MAGTGKSEILEESQQILLKNNAIHNFISASPTHKACQIIYRLPPLPPTSGIRLIEDCMFTIALDLIQWFLLMLIYFLQDFQ